MYIQKIIVKNFRLLKDFSIDLEKGLSLVVGKNNSGKTSLLKVLSKFLSANDGDRFQFNDFSVSYRDRIKFLMCDDLIVENDYTNEGISMRIVIRYEEGDDLEYISPILMSLDPTNYYACLGFDYSLGYTEYLKMREDYMEFVAKEGEKKAANDQYTIKGWNSFIEPVVSKYFKINKRTISIDQAGVVNEAEYIDLSDIDNFRTDNLINFKYIDARRAVDNAESDKTLSAQTSQLYSVINDNGEKKDVISRLTDELTGMDGVLSGLYMNLFEDIREKVRQFGGMSPNDMEIEVMSSLSQRDLINGNTTIVYRQANKQLPESFNGLGYMNLLSMIFKIEYIRQQFTRPNAKKPSDINLLFIEEPEAHTHPQMQYVFIQNIKNLLGAGVIDKNGAKHDLQYIISTHSSHIVSDCDFDDIKYMLIGEDAYSVVKNIKSLYEMYEGDKEGISFLRQYLTINRSELFFADKAILIEGDTERILLHAMMEKIDQEAGGDGSLNLLSQNISIVEVGAYSQVFLNFLRFIGLRKICIITDLDTCKKKEIIDKNGVRRQVAEACKWSDDPNLITSNSSLKNIFETDSIRSLDAFTDADKLLDWNDATKKWEKSDNGRLRVCYQVEENGYHARSFEDGFFKINRDFMMKEEYKFKGLKPRYLTLYRAEHPVYDEYMLANKGIESKSELAIDIIYNSNPKNGNGMKYQEWSIPKYIKEGLIWLKKD